MHDQHSFTTFLESRRSALKQLSSLHSLSSHNSSFPVLETLVIVKLRRDRSGLKPPLRSVSVMPSPPRTFRTLEIQNCASPFVQIMLEWLSTFKCARRAFYLMDGLLFDLDVVNTINLFLKG